MLQQLLSCPHVVDVERNRVFLPVNDISTSIVLDDEYEWDYLYVNTLAMTEAKERLFADDIFLVVVYLPIESMTELMRHPDVRKAGGTGLYTTIKNAFWRP